MKIFLRKALCRARIQWWQCTSSSYIFMYSGLIQSIGPRDNLSITVHVFSLCLSNHSYLHDSFNYLLNTSLFNSSTHLFILFNNPYTHSNTDSCLISQISTWRAMWMAPQFVHNSIYALQIKPFTTFFPIFSFPLFLSPSPHLTF